MNNLLNDDTFLIVTSVNNVQALGIISEVFILKDCMIQGAVMAMVVW